MSSYDHLLAALSSFWNVLYMRWRTEELFSTNWYIIVGSMVVMYTIFIKYIDKTRLRELLLYGSFLAVSFGYIDAAGTTRGWWVYKTHLLPINPSLFPFTYTLHPMVHVFAYQYSSSWRSFAVVNTIATLLLSFVGQPFYVGLQILEFRNWNYFYTFIVSLVVTFFAKAVVNWLTEIEQTHAKQIKEHTVFTPKLQPAMKRLDEDQENDPYNTKKEPLE